MNKNDKQDAEFLTMIICQICEYSVQNNMDPDETLKTIADNILAICSVSTFKNWKSEVE